MTPYICGYVTHLGYLFCHKCSPMKGPQEAYTPIYSDSLPHNEEPCDLCKRVLKEVEE